MNVQEIVKDTTGTIVHYIVTVLTLTLVIVWVFTAYRNNYKFRPGTTFWQRLGWPVFLVLRLFGQDPYAPAVD